jgi:hypothetical protein
MTVVVFTKLNKICRKYRFFIFKVRDDSIKQKKRFDNMYIVRLSRILSGNYQFIVLNI